MNMRKIKFANVLSHDSIYNFCSISIIFALCVFNIIASSQYANSALIAQDDPQFGQLTITYDTDTGLDWLHPYWSRNNSYDDIETDHLGSGNYLGFRHATSSEVMGLFTTAGLAPLPQIGAVQTDLQYYPAAFSFVNLFGPPTLVRSFPVGLGGNFQTWNRVAGFCASDDGQDVYTAYAEFAYSPDALRVSVVLSDPSFRIEYVGNWLVREHAQTPVPEPATSILFTIGALGLAVSRRIRDGFMTGRP